MGIRQNTVRPGQRPCLRAIYLGMGIVLLAGCSDLFKPFQQMSAIDPCDPGSSVYQASSHYFERDFLKHDGSLDYKKLMRLQDPQSSPCDPLYNPGLVHSAPPD